MDGSEDDNKNDYDFTSVPWQPSPSNLQNIDEASRYEDMPPSIFSPTGRLHPVEATVRASKTATPMSNLLVAMRCRDGLLVISTIPISPHVDARTATIAVVTNTTRSITSGSVGSNDTSDICFESETRDGTGNATSASTANKIANTTGNNDGNFHPSLFLFDQTCTSTVTGAIFDIHPCIVGATAGNAVDNRIMRTKLLALGLNALEVQGTIEEDVAAGRVAKDLANQLQVVTQDIAAAQKQKLGRMLASSAVVLGSRKIWRIDPTGQFWDCQVTVLGEDADRTEEEFFRRLLKECESNQFSDVQELLDSISQNEALALVEDFLQTRITRQQNSRSLQSSTATKLSHSNTESSAKKSDNPPAPDFSSHIYWQAVILDYSSLTRRGTPRRELKRGLFGVRNEP